MATKPFYPRFLKEVTGEPIEEELFDPEEAGRLLEDPFLDRETAFPQSTGFDQMRAIKKAGLPAIPALPDELEPPTETLFDELGTLNKEALLGLATSEASNVSKVKLDDGTEVEFTAPQLPTTAGETPIEGRASAEPRPVPEVSAPEPIKPTLLGRAGAAITSPTGRLILAEIGKAFTASVPTSGLHQLAGAAGGLAQADAFNQYKAEIRAGRVPGPGITRALTPELQNAAEKAIREERVLALQESRAAIANAYTKRMTEATPTYAQKVETQEDLIGMQQANKLELFGMSNKWMRVGEGIVFNWENGEIKVIGQEGRDAVSLKDMNPGDYRLFLELISGETLPRVYEKYKAKLEAEGYSSLREIQEAMSDPESGQIVWGQLNNILDPQDRIAFGEAFNQYATGMVMGVSPAQIYEQRIRAVETGVFEVTSKLTGEKHRVRIDPLTNEYIDLGPAIETPKEK